MDNILDTELIWHEFLNDLGNSQEGYAQRQRYIRLNPQVASRVPKMDEKHGIEQLYENVRSTLQSSGMRNKLRRIANRLVASSFYFERAGLPREADGVYIVHGELDFFICLIYHSLSYRFHVLTKLS